MKAERRMQANQNLPFKDHQIQFQFSRLVMSGGASTEETQQKPASSPEPSTPTRKNFTVTDDLVLLRCVNLVKPWEAAMRTTNGIMKAFEVVADKCRAVDGFLKKDGPALRTRFGRLVHLLVLDRPHPPQWNLETHEPETQRPATAFDQGYREASLSQGATPVCETKRAPDDSEVSDVVAVNQHDKAKVFAGLIDEKARLRELRRARQFRYRRKKVSYANSLAEETYRLRRVVEKLELERRAIISFADTIDTA
ncbi:hypothetical protein L917_14403 [Phytophthora nicotianae]|uniref:Uncharacterized protein n=1 Tax=Phytophthora nicotianae TaxID=4792 RepID=W2KLW4_PHYNI|nr:hypothetical protein L917_14403 [Phytophthora nicotianae]